MNHHLASSFAIGGGQRWQYARDAANLLRKTLTHTPQVIFA